jgi:HK97 family phage portal protein
MNQSQYLFDGQKAIPLQKLPPEAWTVHGGASTTELTELYDAVAFLYRAIGIRANDISALPWSITRGDTEIWNHEMADVPAELEPLSDFVELLWRTEESLCLGSESFWHKERNQVRIVDIRWLDPDSMTPIWERSGLQFFERRIDNQKIMLPVEDVVYVWMKGQRETEPRTSPAAAALTAAKVISSTDEFTTAFFERGAVKASVLNVDVDTSTADRDAIKAWWKRLFSGVSNAFAAEVIRGPTTVTQIGEGVNELQDSELTKEKREDILTALGIPHSIALSNAANFATSEQDDLHYYNKTILPEAATIQRQLNDQLFIPMGLQFSFKPQELSVFQEDEEQRAASIGQLVRAGYPLSVASEILGVTLPEGMEYADLDQDEPEPEPEPEPQPVIVQVPESQTDDALTAEIRTFQRWASKRKKPNPDNFHSDILGSWEKTALLTEWGMVEEDSKTGDAFFQSSWDNYP